MFSWCLSPRLDVAGQPPCWQDGLVLTRHVVSDYAEQGRATSCREPGHVCETHAGRCRRVAEDFPADIDVAPTGPARIRSYEALEYVQLVVPPPPC